MKVQMARSGGTFCKRRNSTEVRDGGRLHTALYKQSPSYLSVGCGFKEAETVPEPLTGQTQLNLLLQDGGSTLQDDLVILYPKQPTTSVTGLFTENNNFKFSSRSCAELLQVLL